MATFNVLDSALGECIQTAIYRLSDKKEGDAKFKNAKYTYKWKKKTLGQLYCFSCMKYANLALWICFVLWIIIILLTTAAPYVYLARAIQIVSLRKTPIEEEE